MTLHSKAAARTWAQGGFALLDQGALSVVNFAISFFLVRVGSVAEFGLFALIFSFVIFFNGLHGALLVGPMMVLSQGKGIGGRDRFISGIFLFHLVMALGMVFAAIAGALVIRFFVDGADPKIFVGVALALCGMQISEFLRKCFYARAEIGRSFLITMFFCIFQIGALLFLWSAVRASWLGQTDWATAGNIFVSITASSAVGVVVGVLLLRRHLCLVSIEEAKSALAECWRFGRWGGASNLVSLGYVQALYFFLGILGGTAAVAQFDAPRLVVMPCIILLTAWGNMIVPRAALLFRQEGKDALIRSLWAHGWPLLAVIGAYLSVVSLFPNTAVAFLLGEKYSAANSLVYFWAGIVLLSVLSTVFSMFYYCALHPQYATYTRLLGSFVGFPAGILLFLAWSVEGMAMARVLAELTLLVVGIFFCVRLYRRI